MSPAKDSIFPSTMAIQTHINVRDTRNSMPLPISYINYCTDSPDFTQNPVSHRLFLSLCFMTNTPLHLYFTRTTMPQGNITIFAYIHGSFMTIQHLTDTLAFKDHWSHDLHDVKYVLSP